MSSNESLTRSDEIPSEQVITIQPSGIAPYAGQGDWLPAGNEPAQEAGGGLAMLHAIRRHWLVILSTGLACAAVSGTALWMVLKPQYKAVALLELAPSPPVVIKATADESGQGPNEFDIFREHPEEPDQGPFRHHGGPPRCRN